MSEEYQISEGYFIVRFDSVIDAVDFARDTWPESNVCEAMYAENEDNEFWICVLAVCDICGYKDVFFAPACIYEDGITACECDECGNMSLYPREGNFNDDT